MDPSPKLPVYSLERDKELRNILGGIQLGLIKTSSEKLDELQGELSKRSKYLVEKYGYSNATRYAMFHILSGSSIKPEVGATNNDFPGEDSVEKFIYYLVGKYKND